MLKTISRVLHSKGFTIIVLVVSLLVLFIQADRRYGYTSSEEKPHTNIISDGTGYYAYLPQYIVYPEYKGFAFYEQVMKRYPDKAFFSMLYFDPQTAEASNKFYTGTALVQSPFYLIGHAYASMTQQADGYSTPYRLSIQFAALFYWLIGVIALLRLFKRMGYSQLVVLSGIVLLTFGTNLNLYAAYYVSLSHVYSFALIACFLNVAHSWSKTEKSSSFLWMCLLFGLIGIIRPVNVLILLILPFFFSSFTDFGQRIRTLFLKQWKVVFIGGVLIWLPVFIQLWVHYDQSGTFSLYTYNNEGFDNLFTPQFFNVLFSYEKGFFVYAPVLFLVFPGIYFLLRKHPPFFLFGWALTTCITLYMICSWWSWEYGGGLGMRPLIEFLPLYLLPILALFQYAPKWLKAVSGIVVIGGIFLYQVFQIQFNKDIILYSGMNKERFWHIFLKTDDRYKWMLAYDYQQLPEKQFIPYKSYSLGSAGWEQSGATLSIHQEHIQWPFYARFKGKVTIHDQANNPTLVVSYFRDGYLVDENMQPFGNQIETVGKATEVLLEFNPKPEAFDSVLVTYQPNGAENTLHTTRLQLLHEK